MREIAPIGIDAAVAKVAAKADKFLEACGPNGPAAGYHDYVEKDKDVYVTVEVSKGLVNRWKGRPSGSAKFICTSGDSSNGAQVGLRLQLKEKWGTWDQGKSPFNYHIPIDTYHSPKMKKAEEEKKAQEAAKRKHAAMMKALAEAQTKKEVKKGDAKAEGEWRKKWENANRDKKF